MDSLYWGFLDKKQNSVMAKENCRKILPVKSMVINVILWETDWLNKMIGVVKHSDNEKQQGFS